MCRADLVTTSRGRSGAPKSFFRPRSCRRILARVLTAVPLCEDSETAISLTSLSDLATDLFARVPNALALVRLRLAQFANVRSDLADPLLVDAQHREPSRRLDVERDALRGADLDRVAVAESELQLRRPLRHHPVADSDDLQLLLVTVGHTGHHVGHQGPGQTVQRLAQPLVVGPGDLELAALGTGDLDRFGDHMLKSAFGPFHRHRLPVDAHLHTSGNRYGEPANA